MLVHIVAMVAWGKNYINTVCFITQLTRFVS